MRKLTDMSMRNRLCLSLLVAGLAALPSCRGVPQPPPVESAGLRIDVEKCKAGRRGIVAEVRIHNSYEQRLTFENENVRLLVSDSEEVSGVPYRSFRRGTPTVQAKGNLDFRWVFKPMEDLPPGNYKVEIRDFMLDDVPTGQTAVFEIAL